MENTLTNTSTPTDKEHRCNIAHISKQFGAYAIIYVSFTYLYREYLLHTKTNSVFHTKWTASGVSHKMTKKPTQIVQINLKTSTLLKWREKNSKKKSKSKLNWVKNLQKIEHQLQSYRFIAGNWINSPPFANCHNMINGDKHAVSIFTRKKLSFSQ